MILQSEVDHLLQRLADVPARISEAFIKIPKAKRLSGLPGDQWSAVEIMAHLRASDDIVAYRLYGVLAREDPMLLAFDERRWAEVAGYAQSDFESLLKTYTLRRAELVKMLRQVALEDWERSGRHEVKGTVSLLEITMSLVEHEEEHCAQLEAL